MYTSRLAKILLICMEHKGYITYQTLSQRLQISKRTIMRELTQVNTILEKENITLLFKKGTGIKLEGSVEAIEKLKITLMATQVTVTSKEERQQLLCLELLNGREIQKVAHYARLFDVSQTTIINDLDDLLPFFIEQSLHLNKRPGIGIQVVGKEENVRKALSLLINKSIGHHLMDVDFDRYNIQEVVKQLFACEDSTMKKLLNQDILQEILEELKQQRKKMDLSYMAKNSYIGLLIHLMIAVTRIKQGEAIAYNEKMEDLDYEADSYEKAQYMIACLSKRFSISFPHSETVFIAIHLESAKKALLSEEQEDYQKYLPLITRMLAVFKQQGYIVSNDTELLQGIIAHLKPTMIRLQFGLPIYNPMLKKIKEDYTQLFSITKLACQEITALYGYEVNEDEVGYVLLHFGAAIERQKHTMHGMRDIKVGIVCSSGIGMSALLTARLRQILDANVYLQPLSLDQVEDTDCEILVSTFHLHHDHAITIHPLLSNKDIYMIKEKIKEKRMIHKRTLTKPNNDVDLTVLLSNVQNVLDAINIYTLPSTISKIEAISLISTYLSDSPEILEEQLKAREEKGSTVYHTLGFALLHCATDTITTCELRIFRAEDIVFKDPSLAHIRVIIVMLIPQKATKEQQSLMSYITTMVLENTSFYETIITASIETVKRALNTLLKQYLVQYLQEDQ